MDKDEKKRLKKLAKLLLEKRAAQFRQRLDATNPAPFSSDDYVRTEIANRKKELAIRKGEFKVRPGDVALPIRLDHSPSPMRLAASLGDERARAMFPHPERNTLDDAFAILMSCNDVIDGDYGPPTFWPYTLEAAMRMAIAVFRGFLPEWQSCFELDRTRIPTHIPEDFANRVIAAVTKWIVTPETFSWSDHSELYAWTADDVCLNGYLGNDFPQMPSMVRAYCYGACSLIDIENGQPNAGPLSHEYNPQGVFGARMADAIGVFLLEGAPETRVRGAIKRELIPWCLGDFDPLREPS